MKLEKQYLERIKRNDLTIVQVNLQGVINHYKYLLDTCAIEDIQLLVEAIKNNTVVENLTISGVYLGKTEMSLIAEIFVSNKKIKKISFINNLMWEGIENLAQVLRFNTSVSHLDLRHNPVRERDSEALITMLKSNRSLVSLELSPSHYLEAIGLGGDETIQTPPNLMVIIKRIMAYNQSLLPNSNPNPNVFFANNLSLKQEITKHLDLLETKWQLINKEEVNPISLQALKYLQYSLELGISSEKEATQEMFRRFPEARSAESIVSGTNLFDKLSKTVPLDLVENTGSNLM